VDDDVVGSARLRTGRRLYESAVTNPADVPEATVSRLPQYLRALSALAEAGLRTVSSEALAEAAGVGSAKLRKDLSYLGSYGTRGARHSGFAEFAPGAQARASHHVVVHCGQT
jgi:hypothetical protein